MSRVATERTPELRVDRLRALVAVARAGGFSRAARALGRTQSSISQAVALLEEDVGGLLVVRDGRRVHLTDLGAVLVSHGERLLAGLAEARAAIAGVRDVSTGTLTLGASDTFCVHLLPPVLAAFRAAHPGVELRLDHRPSPVLAARVAERELDVAVLALPLPPAVLGDRIKIRSLAPLDDVAVAAPDHPIARRRRLRVEQLTAHTLLLLDRSTAARAHLDAALGAPPRALESSSVEVLKRLAALGFGVAVVPALAARAEVERGELVARPITGLPRRRVGLALPAPGPATRAAAAFAALAEHVLAGA